MEKRYTKGPLPLRILKAMVLAGLLVATWLRLVTVAGAAVTAVSANDFLNSIGVNLHIQHGQPAAKLVGPLKYTGVRSVRDEADGNFDMAGLLLLYRNAGVRIVFGPGSGAHDDRIAKTIRACEELAAAGALQAVEGPNEPNNFGGVTYANQNSNALRSWIPVAKFQRELYDDVKSDPVLKNYPVYGVSEVGAETDNSGLQFLVVPPGAGTLMPAGTRFADFVNCHNYVGGHLHSLIDNQATLAASTKPNVPIDSLYSENGITWLEKYTGYSESQLNTMPKVTTETGWKTDNTPAGDDRQGKVLINVYLAQYKAGWKYTAVYEFADDSDGAYGFYKQDYTTPRKAAYYLHNFTTILADNGPLNSPGKVDYSIPNRPATVHDLLMQKNDGTFELAIWGEQVKGANKITVNLGVPYKIVRVYDPTISAKPLETLDKIKSVPLTVSDHVLIVEFK
jgi:hypothetical protein